MTAPQSSVCVIEFSGLKNFLAKPGMSANTVRFVTIRKPPSGVAVHSTISYAIASIASNFARRNSGSLSIAKTASGEAAYVVVNLGIHAEP